MNWLILALAALLLSRVASAEGAPPRKRKVIELWPKAVRDTWETQGEEKATTSPWRGTSTITRITNVTNPTLTLYRPPKAEHAAPAVVVCPGGGYGILAWDLEGVEVCQWLNSLGITGVLLKYRVPRQRDGALQDAQRAVGLVRAKAKEWGIKPRQIGILGFSAGGHLAARLCTNFKSRAYTPVDRADTVSCRPDFAVLIYPAYMEGKDGLDAATLPVAKATPPTFIAIATGDKFATGALHYVLALKQARVRAEAHFFALGSHGCGLRAPAVGLTTWPARCREWLRAIQVLPE